MSQLKKGVPEKEKFYKQPKFVPGVTATLSKLCNKMEYLSMPQNV